MQPRGLTKSLRIVGALIALTLVAACQPTPSAPKTDTAAKSGAVTPKVNRVVMSVIPPAEETNELRNLNQPQVWQLRPMYEYLIGMDAETGKLVPQLATEWALEPDGMSYRFKLRQNVPFHGGHGNFGAQDVLFTWKDLTQQDSVHGEAGYFRSVVKDIEIVNEHEVVFRMAGPDGNFLVAISQAQGAMEMRSKAHFDKMGAPTMQSGPLAGTGPYQFKERTQGQNIIFSRVPYQHWRVTPDFPEFEFRFQREPSTRLAALLSGEVHVTQLPEDLLTQAQGQGYGVVKGLVPGLRTFLSFYCCYVNDSNDPSKGFKYPDTPLKDVRVRKALNKAIDRDQINKSFFAGKGELMIMPHHHPTRMGWNPEWQTKFQEEYGYDPDKAKALLAEAGYGPGKPLSTSMLLQPLPQYAGAEDVQEAIAGYWRAVGVNVESVTRDPGEIAQRSRQQQYDNHVTVTGTSSAQLIAMVYTSTTAGRNPGAAAVQDHKVEGLVRQLYSTVDTQKQDQLWRELGDYTFLHHGQISLFWLPAQAVINTKIVSDYVFPGAITGTWTHVEGIKAAP
jgi:ABC-type transport system substrate-binding protein